jgi:protein TonB
MNKKKKHHFDKLQKSSILFTQLGLVLALLAVYLALEFTTEKKDLVFDKTNVLDEPLYVIQYPIGVIEKKTIPKEPVKPKEVVPIDKIIIDDNDSSAEETVLNPVDTETTDDLIGLIVEAPGDGIDADVTLPFSIIEEAPIYPGCEGLDKEESKKCFTKQITKFVNKKFNTDLASSLNLNGKQKIWVIFKIDKTGTVTDITARAPHKSLEKEAIRIVQKLPQMTPGKQRKKPVGVKYTLPIAFVIE